MYYYLIDGGYLMIPILLCSLISLTFLIERFIFVCVYYYNQKKIAQSYVSDTLNLVKQNAFDKAIESSEKSIHPFSKHFKVLIQKRSLDLSHALEEEIELKHFELEKQHFIIETIIKISPLFGILGTVVGIILTFQAMDSTGLENIKAVTSGIGQALNTTAFGLFVAVFSIIGLSLYNQFITRFYEQFIIHLDHLSILLNTSNEDKKL